jgi:hypothetical protein
MYWLRREEPFVRAECAFEFRAPYASLFTPHAGKPVEVCQNKAINPSPGQVHQRRTYPAQVIAPARLIASAERVACIGSHYAENRLLVNELYWVEPVHGAGQVLKFWLCLRSGSGCE